MKEKLEQMRENIVMFAEKYDELQSNISSIKMLIDNLSNKAKFKSFG